IQAGTGTALWLEDLVDVQVGRTVVRGDELGADEPVFGAFVDGFKVVHLEQVVLLDVGKQENSPVRPALRAATIAVGHTAQGKFLVGAVVVMQGGGNLLQVVLAGAAVGGLAHFLHGGDEQANEDRNDGNNHEQFNEGEPQPAAVRQGAW